MTGWTAMAATHFFEAPDGGAAEAIATALAEFGFAKVGARPYEDHWLVQAIDDGPYTLDSEGRRLYMAVFGRAKAIAREHGGWHSTTGQHDVSRVEELVTGTPFTMVNPGARPVVAQPPVAEEPPALALALGPAALAVRAPRLDGIDRVDWESLEHAHGDAGDIPGLLRLLADFEEPEWEDARDELIGDNLIHQETCYTATAPAMPVLAELFTCGAGRPEQRRDLLADLLWAAHLQLSQVIHGFADPDTQAVHEVIRSGVPSLLGRWEHESPAIRYLLAGLAAVYPDVAGEVAGHIRQWAAQTRGTSNGAYLDLICLVFDSDERSIATALDVIAQWRDGEIDDLLDVDDVAPSVAARYIVAKAFVMSA